MSAIAHAAVQRKPGGRPRTAGALAKRIRAWQRADEDERERTRLEREAREALAGAEDVKADERLRLVERASLRLQQLRARVRLERAGRGLDGEPLEPDEDAPTVEDGP